MIKHFIQTANIPLMIGLVEHVRYLFQLIEIVARMKAGYAIAFSQVLSHELVRFSAACFMLYGSHIVCFNLFIETITYLIS